LKPGECYDSSGQIATGMPPAGDQSRVIGEADGLPDVFAWLSQNARRHLSD